MRTIREAIVALTLMAQRRAEATRVRRAVVGLVATLRGDADKARGFLEGTLELEAWSDAAAAAWTPASDLDRGGRVDAADLRVWLELARRAGVAAVPARPILDLTFDEVAALSGAVELPAFAHRAIARGLERALGDDLPQGNTPEQDAPARPDMDALHERLFAAMDDVPEGWMVRSHIAGPLVLKSLAGSGLAHDDAQAGPAIVAQDSGFALGPGWVRHGNRRRVDATDARSTELFAQGHGPVLTFLARPWIEADRRVVGPDPHRHGSPFAGKGSWPCEWRVFVEQGRVVGVSSYYGWAGGTTPKDARMALAAAQAAQRVVDAGVALDLQPTTMSLLIAQRHRDQGATMPGFVAEMLDRFGAGFSCTLDFLEADGGVVLLEGGPAHMPMDGGHPCAFAGVGMAPGRPICDTRGVALRLMDHVVLADPSTWKDGDRTGAILSWDEARALAAS